MQFSDFGPRKVIAAFDGGEITDLLPENSRISGVSFPN